MIYKLRQVVEFRTYSDHMKIGVIVGFTKNYGTTVYDIELISSVDDIVFCNIRENMITRILVDINSKMKQVKKWRKNRDE